MNVTIETNSELEASMAVLRQHGRTLKEFAAWLQEHPQVFPGMEHIPKQYLTIGINFEPNSVLYELTEAESLAIEVGIRVTFDARPADLIERLKPQPTGDYSVALELDHELELQLADWPLATALSVGLYFHHAYYTDESQWLQRVTRILDKYLNVHFPSFTIDKIGELQNADLLVRYEEGNVHVDSVVDMLFTSRDALVLPDTPLSIPTDLTP